MREKEFIDKNKEEWRSFEQEFEKQHKDPQKLSELYIKIINDLSYALTHYRNRTVRYYLNSVSRDLYLRVNKYRLPAKDFTKTFWTEELPSILYFSRKELLVSLLVFLIAVIAGMFSTHQDPDFARAILGDSYVNMTLENIEKGDPMAVYKDEDAFGMFLQITLNNIYVSVLVFVTGLFAGVGTVGMLISNGVMLGSFQYFFFNEGIGGEAALTIWQHGTIEISSIVIAGGAGLLIGRSFIFPGTYTRSQALKDNALKALKIITGLIPMFVLAGFIESYVTRQTELAPAVRIAVIVLSAILILGYYAVLPFLIPAATREKYRIKILHRQSEEPQIDLTKVKSQNQLFKEAFIMMRRVFNNTGVVYFATAAAAALVLAFFSSASVLHRSHSALVSYEGFKRFFDFSVFPLHYLVLTGLLTAVSFFTLRGFLKSRFHRELPAAKLPLLLLISALFSSVFFVSSAWQFALFAVLLPLWFEGVAVIAFYKKVHWSKLTVFRKAGSFSLSYVFMIVISAAVLVLLNQPLINLLSDTVRHLLPVSEELQDQSALFVLYFMQQLGFAFIAALFSVYGVLMHHHRHELFTAENLKKRLEAVKNKYAK